jgi:prepilin-type N-terminal cleavage/methylation domain-containing protein
MRRTGFTLVELMIVVAIIGLLSAIAIPNYMSAQYRSKRAELPVNVASMRTAERAYEALYDTYLEAPQCPTGTPGKTQQPWGEGNEGFAALGWLPHGRVRGVYEITTVPGGASSSGGEFHVVGRTDVDGDGVLARYTATQLATGALVTENFVY